MRIRIQVLMQLNMDVKPDPGGKNVNFGHPSPRGRWGTGNLFLHPRHHKNFGPLRVIEF